MKQKIVEKQTAGGFHRGWEKLYTGRLPAVCQISIKKAQEKAPGPSYIWRPLPDLNRCRRRERAVSWAGLDEGDFETVDLYIYYALK